MRAITAYFIRMGKNPAEREKNKKERTTRIVFWKRAGRVGPSARAAGVALAQSRWFVHSNRAEDGVFGTDACRWADAIVGADGNSFLTVSIFSEK